MIALFLCSMLLKATKWLMFSIKLFWNFFGGAIGNDAVKWMEDVFVRPLQAGGSFFGTEDAGRDKDRGRLPGERTGNEIRIDQIYLLSVRFKKVSYQSSGVPSNGRPPQEHGVRDGNCPRLWQTTGRYFTGPWGVCGLMGVKERGSMKEQVGGVDKVWSDQVLICLPFTNSLSSGIHGGSNRELSLSLLCVRASEHHLHFCLPWTPLLWDQSHLVTQCCWVIYR